MQITIAPADPFKGCDECLTKDVVLFTIRTKISKLTLCEKHMREAVIATTETGIEARRVGLTHGKSLPHG